MALHLGLRERHIGIGIFTSTILVLGLFLVFNFVHFFSGVTGEAMEILGILVQSSSALMAIVFAFLIFISQTIIGKYVSGTLEYIFNNRGFVVIFVFYAIATLIISLSMWIYPNNHWSALVDVSTSLFLTEILLLPILFVVQSKLLNPKTIIDTFLSKASLIDKKTVEDTMERTKLVFSIIYKLAENREYGGATYGLKAVTNIVTSNPDKKDLGLYLWAIPNYERIGVECFKFDPNISVFVISQFNEIVNHLTGKLPFVLANACSRITTACFNIASTVEEKPYGESSLVASYYLLQKIYVSKSLVDYSFSAYEELNKMEEIIKMMRKANVPTHLMIGFELQISCENLIDAEKYEMMQYLFLKTLYAFPRNDAILLSYASIIFQTIPLNKKEIADDLIREIKRKFEKVEIQFEKTKDTSRTNIGAKNGVIEVISGNEEIAKKVDWFKEI